MKHIKKIVIGLLVAVTLLSMTDLGRIVVQAATTEENVQSESVENDDSTGNVSEEQGNEVVVPEESGEAFADPYGTNEATKEILTPEQMKSEKPEHELAMVQSRGLLRASSQKFVYTRESGSTINLYNPDSLNVHSYIDTYGYIMEYLGMNSKNSNYYNIRFAGTVAAIYKDDVLKLMDASEIKSFPFYRNENGKVNYYIAKYPDLESSYTFIAEMGDAPSWMVQNQKYYSFDGVYFTDSINNLGYENNQDRAVNKDKPYYDYYVNLPIRSETNYSASQLNSAFNYLYGNSGVAGRTTVMSGTGQNFINIQNTYGTNAVIVMAMGMHESAYGTSNQATGKYNLFGIGAVDSNPDDAYRFASAADCINNQGRFLSSSYASTTDWRYYGSHVGNKSSGMNTKYASDPFWGYKIASYMQRIDSYLGRSDYGYYSLGMVSENNAVYKSNITYWFNMPIKTAREVRIYPVILTSTVAGNGYYPMIVDAPYTASGGIDDNYGYYNRSVSKGAMWKDDVLIFNEGRNGMPTGILTLVNPDGSGIREENGTLKIDSKATGWANEPVASQYIKGTWKQVGGNSSTPMSAVQTAADGRYYTFGIPLSSLKVGTYTLNVGVGSSSEDASYGGTKTLTLSNGLVAKFYWVNDSNGYPRIRVDIVKQNVPPTGILTLVNADGTGIREENGVLKIDSKATGWANEPVASQYIKGTWKQVGGSSSTPMSVVQTATDGRYYSFGIPVSNLKVGTYTLNVGVGSSNEDASYKATKNVTLSNGLVAKFYWANDSGGYPRIRIDIVNQNVPPTGILTLVNADGNGIREENGVLKIDSKATGWANEPVASQYIKGTWKQVGGSSSTPMSVVQTATDGRYYSFGIPVSNLKVGTYTLNVGVGSSNEDASYKATKNVTLSNGLVAKFYWANDSGGYPRIRIDIVNQNVPPTGILTLVNADGTGIREENGVLKIDSKATGWANEPVASQYIKGTWKQVGGSESTPMSAAQTAADGRYYTFGIPVSSLKVGTYTLNVGVGNNSEDASYKSTKNITLSNGMVAKFYWSNDSNGYPRIRIDIVDQNVPPTGILTLVNADGSGIREENGILKIDSKATGWANEPVASQYIKGTWKQVGGSSSTPMSAVQTAADGRYYTFGIPVSSLKVGTYTLNVGVGNSSEDASYKATKNITLSNGLVVKFYWANDSNGYPRIRVDIINP